MRNDKEVTRTGMTEIVPSEEQQRVVQIYKAIMAQVFVRYTPKMERLKWLLPSDNVSEWIVEEKEYIRIYRRGDAVKVEVKYYALPYENMCKDQIDFALTRVLIESSKVISLDIMFETLLEISMNIFNLMTKYRVPVLVKDLRNFMTSFIVEFDDMKMIDLGSRVIFHDCALFSKREDFCVSSISIDETDPEEKAKGKVWRGLTLVNCSGGTEPGKMDWPPEDYVLLRDKYTRGEIGKDFNLEEYNARREEIELVDMRVKEILVANNGHYRGAHEYCLSQLAQR